MMRNLDVTNNNNLELESTLHGSPTTAKKVQPPFRNPRSENEGTTPSRNPTDYVRGYTFLSKSPHEPEMKG